MTTPTLDALVIGAGPTGLVMASDLLRRGLTCRIVDLNEAPTIWSKAQIVHARTLELLERLGVTEALLAAGKPVRRFNMFTERGQRAVFQIPIDDLDTEYGFMHSVPQRDTELVLERNLERLCGRVERQVRLLRFAQDEGGVDATLQHPDGREEEVRAAWLVGCDGAHSTVRHALGLPFEGTTYEFSLIQADVRVDLPIALPDDEVAAFIGPGCLFGLLPLPGERRYRFLVPIAPGGDTSCTLERFQAVADQVGPPGTRVSDPAWMIGFKIHCRLSSHYREGRVFLAGDAAHIHSPAGGQGMNMGIQDAFNLAWKLALVQTGRARPELLDSYEAERRPIAAAVLAGTDAATSGLALNFTLQNALAVELRNQIMGFVGSLSVVRRKFSRTLSMLDVHYPESPILAQDRPSLAEAHLVRASRDELPTLRDWFDFGNGPAPGARAVDVRLAEGDEHTTPRLFDLLRGVGHTLLLFDGAAATELGYHNLRAIAERVRHRHGDLITTHVLVPYAARPAALSDWSGSVVLDPEGRVHQRYGARSECLYVIRPDGYVGYRCQPADATKLLEYLGRVLV